MPSVLIVEDDRDTREMLARFLELEGFEVREAANGQLALETLHENGATCVILLDLMMPVMNGWQFRLAQVMDPDIAEIPVVVVTAAGRRTPPSPGARPRPTGAAAPPPRRHALSTDRSCPSESRSGGRRRRRCRAGTAAGRRRRSVPSSIRGTPAAVA